MNLENNKENKPEKISILVKKIPLWITPNMLTESRFILAPLIILIFILNLSQYPWYYVAFVLYAIAVMLDVADGDLARWRKQESALGKILDPMADKVLNIPIFFLIGSWFGKNYNWIYLAMIIIALETALFIIAMAKHFLRNRITLKTGANIFGKTKMGFEAGTILYILLLSPWIDLGIISKDYTYQVFLTGEMALIVSIVCAVGSILGHLFPETMSRVETRIKETWRKLLPK